MIGHNSCFCRENCMATGKKAVVAMSGGVHSSVAAALLKRQGFECVGVFMRLGSDPTENAEAQLVACSPQKQAAAQNGRDNAQWCGGGGSHKQGCCSTSDAADARYVAGLLEIPFY